MDEEIVPGFFSMTAYGQRNRPGLFLEFRDQYIYRFSQEADNGLSMERLYYYIFISLDRFKKKHQNENIGLLTCF